MTTRTLYGRPLKEHYYKSNLKQLMEKYDISARQLAEHFGCTTSQVYHYISGRSSLINGARMLQLQELFPWIPDIVKAIDEHVNPNFRKSK